MLRYNLKVVQLRKAVINRTDVLSYKVRSLILLSVNLTIP